MTEAIDKTRRKVCGMGLSALACSLSSPAFARWPRPPVVDTDRHLSFHNLHTDERLQVTYWQGGIYDRAAWEKINHILRDHYTGQSHVMDLRLVDLLHDLQTKLENDNTIEIISGYRSPLTNQRLAEASGGVAKNSYHLRGMAIDIRMDGTTLPHLHDTALVMDRGGVGYYPDSQFVHVDVGPIRRWG
jgi:uncharacterized protein YcbK (DUF882 family)